MTQGLTDAAVRMVLPTLTRTGSFNGFGSCHQIHRLASAWHCPCTEERTPLQSSALFQRLLGLKPPSPASLIAVRGTAVHPSPACLSSSTGPGWKRRLDLGSLAPPGQPQPSPGEAESRMLPVALPLPPESRWRFQVLFCQKGGRQRPGHLTAWRLMAHSVSAQAQKHHDAIGLHASWESASLLQIFIRGPCRLHQHSHCIDWPCKLMSSYGNTTVEKQVLDSL